MNKEPRDLDYLQHILDAIARIEEYINDQSEEGFLADGIAPGRGDSQYRDHRGSGKPVEQVVC